MVALEEAGPASLPVHDAARLPRGRTQALAGQLHSAVLALGHVDGTEQRLDDGPAAWSIPQAWVGWAVRMGVIYRGDLKNR